MSVRRVTKTGVEVDFDPNLARKDRVTKVGVEIDFDPNLARKDRVTFLGVEIEFTLAAESRYGPAVQCM